MEDPVELFFLCLERNWAFRRGFILPIFRHLYLRCLPWGEMNWMCEESVSFFKSSAADWLMCGGLHFHRWISLWRSTVNYSSLAMCGGRRKQMGQETSVGCSFPPRVTQMGSIHSNRSTNCAARLVTGLLQRQEKQSKSERKSLEQWIHFS